MDVRSGKQPDSTMPIHPSFRIVPSGRKFLRDSCAAILCLAWCSCSSVQFTVSADSKIQDAAYTLYQQTVDTFRNCDPKAYASRRSFYKSAYDTLDVMLLRARVDTSAARSDTSVLRNVTDLQAEYRALESIDRSGDLGGGDTLERSLSDMADSFYYLLKRQAGSAPQTQDQGQPKASPSSAGTTPAKTPGKGNTKSKPHGI